MSPRKKSFLLTTDFSDSARIAYGQAIDLCKVYRGKLSLVHVINPTVIPSAYPMVTSDALVSKEKDSQIQSLMVKEIEDYFPVDLKPEAVIIKGVPFLEIIRLAKKTKSDMIIIATHGFTGLNHILFGSTAEKVVRKSPCPVLTVRDPQKPFSLP